MLKSTELAEFINKGMLDEKQIQQVSIDLKICQIFRIDPLSRGAILKEKTILPKYEELQTIENAEHNAEGWWLSQGYYNFIFEEGVDIPKDIATLVIQRSSLLRNGGTLTSSLWDPAFSTGDGKMSSFATINHPVFIEKGARVACMYGWRIDGELPEHLLYNGQYQSKQISESK